MSLRIIILLQHLIMFKIQAWCLLFPRHLTSLIQVSDFPKSFQQTYKNVDAIKFIPYILGIFDDICYTHTMGMYVCMLATSPLHKPSPDPRFFIDPNTVCPKNIRSTNFLRSNESS